MDFFFFFVIANSSVVVVVTNSGVELPQIQVLFTVTTD
jgi:hypothetical protein